MRIHSPPIWLSSASLASTAVASSGIAFSTAGFQGALVTFDNGTQTQSTIVSISQIEGGNEAGQGKWMIKWTPNDVNNDPTIKSVVLATEKDSGTSIAYGESTAASSTNSLLRRDDGDSQDQQSFQGKFDGICAAVGWESAD